MSDFIFTDMTKVENSYQLIATEVLAFIAGRDWQEAGAQYEIWPKSISTYWWRKIDDVIDKKGGFPPDQISANASDAVTYLRDEILRIKGDRIWGLTFTLHPDGKFKIEYDYEKPADYVEDDETGE